MPEERKLVTILFADVTESTALGETLDPEDVRALMGRYYAHARRVISEHGGTLEKFIGDAVMAVFGLPHAHGNDAERALAASLALREAVATDAVLGERLVLHTGINTGEVIATSDPQGSDFLATGDAVNVAARLQQAASPGEIVASERTADAAQAAFLFDIARLVEVKGKRQPLRVFPLKEARLVRRVTRPPFVGRRQDLLQLSVLQARVLEERRPQLVSILAPAGTGKTRLLEELLARLDPADRFHVATARCLPYGQTLTYWPLRGLLTDLLGGEIDKPHVTEAFVRGGNTPEDAVRLADFVLTTLGIECEGATDRESIFTAWRLLVESLARQAPRIVVFEDLHWASESLLDLVEHIMHPRTQVPLFIVVLSRPELLERRPTWGGGRQNFTALALEPLSEAQTRDLVERLTTGLHEAIRERIVERSGGNPFFAIELVRGLAEHGITGKAPVADTLPDTVHAAVLARLDLLSPQERAVVQAASVAGRAFRPELLYAVLDDRTPTQIDAALDALLTDNLVVQASGGAFTFRHALIRDVAHGTLSRAERVRMYGKIAAWLEANSGDRQDEFTELIAYHYREAVLLARQAAVPLELPIDPARAIHYLTRAGQLASRSGAFAEARTYLQSAIDLAPEEEHLRLYEQLGDCVVWGDTAVDAYRQALVRWRGTAERDPLVGVRLLRKLLTAYLRWNVTPPSAEEELVRLLAEAQQLAEAVDDEDERWRVQLAHIWFSLLWQENGTLQEVAEGRSLALAAATYFEARAEWVSFSAALDAYTNLSRGVGAYDDALEASRRRLSIPDLPAMERGDALNMMAQLYFHLGNYSRCDDIVREALAQLRPGEPVGYLAGAVALAMRALYLTGRWSEVDALIPTLEDVWEQVQHDVSTATDVAYGYFTVLDMALAREDQARASTAASVLQRCLPSGQANARNGCSLLAALLEDDPRRIDYDPSNGDWGTNLLMFENEHGVHAPLALIAQEHYWLTWGSSVLRGRCVEIAEALEASDMPRLTAAIDGAESDGLITHTARMRVVLAQRTGDRAQLERARSALEGLGDRRFLRRLDEIAVTLDEEGKVR
jgi:class 3 adenylate cyclase/tetratricopeptide (TPR) repeat protein